MSICLLGSGSGDLKLNLRATPVVFTLSFLAGFFVGGDLTGVLPGVGNVPCSADCAFDLLPGAAWVFAAAFAAVHFELGGCFDFEASNSSSVAWGAKKNLAKLNAVHGCQHASVLSQEAGIVSASSNLPLLVHHMAGS